MRRDSARDTKPSLGQGTYRKRAAGPAVGYTTTTKIETLDRGDNSPRNYEKHGTAFRSAAGPAIRCEPRRPTDADFQRAVNGTETGVAQNAAQSVQEIGGKALNEKRGTPVFSELFDSVPGITTAPCDGS